MQLCNHCGKGIINNAKYCSQCGKKDEVLTSELIVVEKSTNKADLFYYHKEKKKVNKIQLFITNLVVSVILIIIVVINLPFFNSENEPSTVLSGYTNTVPSQTEVAKPEPIQQDIIVSAKPFNSNVSNNLEIDIAVTNNSGSNIFVSSLDFTLSDSEGYTINPTDESVETFDGIELGNGQSTYGTLYFKGHFTGIVYLNFNNIGGNQRLQLTIN